MNMINVYPPLQYSRVQNLPTAKKTLKPVCLNLWDCTKAVQKHY